MNAAAGIDREKARKRLADALRHIGDLRHILQDGSRLAFEKVFCSVAQYRLPKDTFLLIVEEAREIWRQEGGAEMLPSMSKADRHRAQKTETRRAMIAADAHFEN